jgi:hypothetical protein
MGLMLPNVVALLVVPKARVQPCLRIVALLALSVWDLVFSKISPIISSGFGGFRLSRGPDFTRMSLLLVLADIRSFSSSVCTTHLYQAEAILAVQHISTLNAICKLWRTDIAFCYGAQKCCCSRPKGLTIVRKGDFYFMLDVALLVPWDTLSICVITRT